MVAAIGWDEQTMSYLRGNLDLTMIYAYINLIVVLLCSIYITFVMLYMIFGLFSSSTRSSSSNMAARNTKGKIAFMAFLYTIPFYITWIIPSVFLFLLVGGWYGYNVLQGISVQALYTGSVWVATFMPLQGFFNFFVYYLPRLCLTEQKFIQGEVRTLSQLQVEEERGEGSEDAPSTSNNPPDGKVETTAHLFNLIQNMC